MNLEQKKKYCRGCHDNIYNNSADNPSGTAQCWLLKDAEVVWRKEVHIDQRPPWKQKAKRFLSCYRRPKYVYVNPNQEY